MFSIHTYIYINMVAFLDSVHEVLYIRIYVNLHALNPKMLPYFTCYYFSACGFITMIISCDWLIEFSTCGLWEFSLLQMSEFTSDFRAYGHTFQMCKKQSISSFSSLLEGQLYNSLGVYS